MNSIAGKDKKLKIVVVGQTPPPYGGQAIMIEYILNADFKNVEFYHVRMCFSREMNERGKMSIYKVSHLFEIIFKTIYYRIKHNAGVLYYPPSNAPKVSVLRDLILVGCTRMFFRKTIFHFHASGICEYLPSMNFIMRKLAYLILKKPDLGIVLSSFNPPDAKYLGAKLEEVIPYGIPELKGSASILRTYESNKPFSILFMGLLNSTKGEGFLLDAISILNKKGYKIKFNLAGKFETEEYERAFFDKVRIYDLESQVEYLGVITGEHKNQAYLTADLFCFPSFFVSESFGIVLLEAMCYSLPVIATKWRGIQSIVADGKTGFLVDIKNANQIAEKIEFLINRPELLLEMGRNARALYLERYTFSKYIQNLETAFHKI